MKATQDSLISVGLEIQPRKGKNTHKHTKIKHTYTHTLTTGVDYAIDLRGSEVDVILHRQFLDKIVGFFTAADSQTLEDIEIQATQRLRRLREQTTEQLKMALQHVYQNFISFLCLCFKKSFLVFQNVGTSFGDEN